jgi:hypothetical protein
MTSNFQITEELKMPLTGELEHLPIVDLIQLIHSTRKSGTLNVCSHRGEGMLIFSNGYIVSASHSQEHIKIGSILLKNKLVTQEEIDRALLLQHKQGAQKKPLVTILLDSCKLSKEQAFKALETLIEMTLVEMISWTRGRFSFDTGIVATADDYRYLPQTLQEGALDTQMLLMDALRIFDEKVHSGEIEILDDPPEHDPNQSEPIDEYLKTGEESDMDISEDIPEDISEDLLGLTDLDNSERKIPQVFKGLETFNTDASKYEISEASTDSFSEEDRKKLTHFFSAISKSEPQNRHFSDNQAIILFADNPFLEQALMTVSQHEERFMFKTRTRQELETLTEQAILHGAKPLIILNAPDDTFSAADIKQIRDSILKSFLNIDIIQLAYSSQLPFQLQAWQDGLKAVLPLPEVKDDPGYTDQMIAFLLTFQSVLSDQRHNTSLYDLRELKDNLKHLRQFKRAADVSTEILRFLSHYFQRTINFVINKQELIAERSVGILDNKKELSKTLMWRLPLTEESRLQQVFSINECYNGEIPDDELARQLYAKIGEPAAKDSLLLPLKCNNQTVMMIYADNGSQSARQVDSDFFNFFINQASLVMEIALYRRQRIT